MCFHALVSQAFGTATVSVGVVRERLAAPAPRLHSLDCWPHDCICAHAGGGSTTNCSAGWGIAPLTNGPCVECAANEVSPGGEFASCSRCSTGKTPNANKTACESSEPRKRRVPGRVLHYR